MKMIKKLLGFLVIIFVVLMINNVQCSAQETQYTDNVIPTMTSNTLPSGVASASSVYNSDIVCPAYLAFDRKISSTSLWLASKGTSSGWLEYEFLTPKCITKYTIISTNPIYSIKEMPTSWTFEAWDKELSKWVVLDSRSSVTNWSVGVKKEFMFSNNTLYTKYRINITASGEAGMTVGIGEMEMMETVTAPTNLTAAGGNSNVILSWDSIINAQSYIIKRSKTQGGIYETIKTIDAITGISTVTYTDNDLINDTTYYYVVTAIVSGKESVNSNEAFATPTDILGSNNGILELTMTNGGIKSYNLTALELDSFLTWYDKRSVGIGKSYYVFVKKSDIKPFISKKEYISYDKISSFEVCEYNE